MTTARIEQLATQILARFDTVQTIDTMASDLAQLGIEDAYRVQLSLVDQRCARGERIVGRKVAFTSRGTMSQFGVTESAFGSILSGGVFADGDAVPVSRFPAVGAEAEVGFVIGEELKGPGVTIAQALKATTGVVPAIEIINLCITHTPWNALEVIATNAVHVGIILGGQITPLDGLNLRYEGMVAEVNGEPVGSGAGVEVLGRTLVVRLRDPDDRHPRRSPSHHLQGIQRERPFRRAVYQLVSETRASPHYSLPCGRV